MRAHAQSRAVLPQILAIFSLLLALMSATPHAFAQGAAAGCPTPTFAQRINMAVAPVTNTVSGWIFWEVPIRSGTRLAQGSFAINTGLVRDGDRFTLTSGDKTLDVEVDTDGQICSGAEPLAPGNFSARYLQGRIASILPSGSRMAPIGSGFNIAVPADAEVTLRTSGSGIVSKKLTNGSAGIPFIVIWLLLGATFFTLYMGFINVRGFKQSLRIVRGTYDNPNDPGEVTHFQALTAALSGTVGLGNIAGVAIAVSIGGPGATFWMIMAGLFGMSSKFVECTLGVHYRKISPAGIVSGGPMYYLSQGLKEKGLGPLGKVLAVIFSILCIGGAFGAGNMFQVNQSSTQMMDILVPLTGGEASFLAGKPWIIGTIFAFFVGLVIIGGIRGITRVTEKLVPLMAFVYLAGALTVLALHIPEIPGAFGAIITGAFTPEGATGGFIGVLVQGLRRATFSNEAGVGSAAIAHSAAKTKEPVAEGLVALLEPFVDTVVICTITALVIIVTDMHLLGGGMDGIGLTSSAFASVIDWFPYVLSVAVLLFAFSTSITWFYYGQRAFLYLVGDKPVADILFKSTYLLVLILGSSMTLSAVMDFADGMLLAMAFPNMIGLYILAPKVKKMLSSYLQRVESGEIKPAP